MIPYFELSPLRIPFPFLGHLELHAFGALVLTGIIVGSKVALRRARERGIDEDFFHSAIFWMLISGFVGAHLVHVLAYQPQMLRDDPLALFKIWKGISSFGGFFGAFVGLLVYLKKHGQAFGPFADSIMLGLLPGWVFGRTGCYLAHDHPGYRTDFIFAVNYPGGPKHDLGFYEIPFTLLLIVVFEFVRRRKLPAGHIALLVSALYAPYRFFLDFLRTNDKTYLGITPAQFGCLALFIGSVALLLGAGKLFVRAKPAANSAKGTKRAKQKG